MTAPDATRVVLYGRVSSLVNESGVTESRSVDDQLTSLRTWATREGLSVVGEFRDDGISASRYARGKTRPAWQEVLELISTGAVELLAVWAVSRATRDRATWAALFAACIDAGVKLAVDGKIHDPSDPEDGFMLDISAALAVHTSARISKDAKRSVEARAARGAPHGRLIDGYAIEYDPQSGKPLRRVVDPVRGPIIREIAERLLAGDSAYTVAADLNKRGITTRTGKRWMGGNIIKRLVSPTLAGQRVHHGEVLKDVAGDWPPLLTVEEHSRLLALFGDPTRKTNRGGNHVRHLGTGVYLCGVCGAPVRMLSGYRPDGSRRVRYGCSASHCVQRAAEPVDLLVEKTIIEQLSRPDIATTLATGVEDHARDAAAAEVARLRAELVKARELHRVGKLSLDSVAHLESWALPELAIAEERARPKWLPTGIMEMAGPHAAEWWNDPATSMTTKRAIVKALVTVKIMPTGRSNHHMPFDASAIDIVFNHRQPT